MSDKSPFGRWDRDSQIYESFQSNAVDLLKTDQMYKEAKEEWREFFTTSHGNIFDSLPFDNPEEELFIDSLYYDFVVDQIIDLAERQYGFTVENQESNDNTTTLSFDYSQLHSRAVDIAAVESTFDSFFSKEDLIDVDIGFLRKLYESVVSRKVRLALGEYYTPRGVAELAVESLEVEDMLDATFLDPGCGSGVFTSVCIDAKINASGKVTADDLIDNITSSVYGLDLNPVAVKSTKLAYILSLLPLLDQAESKVLEIPVFLTDALQLTRDEPITFQNKSFDPNVDYLIGNPPWITWGRLDDTVKDAWRAMYVEQLNLLPHEGVDLRLGYANDDISIPYVWVCIHHYLKENGGAAFVLKRDIMKGPAGKLLRTLNVSDRPLSVMHIHDFNKLRPFGDQVGANAAIYTLSVDTPPQFPIPTISWTNGDSSSDFSTKNSIYETLEREETEITSLYDDDHTSAWIRRDAERGALGECSHDIRHGVKDDANDVFDIQRSQIDKLEPDLVYPYIKSRHIVKYGLFGHDLRLVPIKKANEDNEVELKNKYPRTYEYLQQNRDVLDSRSSSWLQDGPFYNVFGLGDYTWADYKVAWCRLGFKPHFSVISTVDDPDLGEKIVVPGDHYMFIATKHEREAHFLCGLLNSSLYQRCLKDIASEGKASLSKTTVSKLELPEWHETEKSHRLASLSKEAHEIVQSYINQHRNDNTIGISKRAYNQSSIEGLNEVQGEIDQLVENMLMDGTLFVDVGQSTLSTF